MPSPKPRPTMEFGHTMYSQYNGEPALISDPRPNTRTKRGISPEDHEGRAKYVDELVARYKNGKDEE